MARLLQQPFARIDSTALARQQEQASFFAICLLPLLLLLYLGARNGMPLYTDLVLSGICVSAVTLYLPFHLLRWAPVKIRILWLAPVTVLSGLIALVPTYIGGAGLYVLMVLAAVVVLPKLATLRGVARWSWLFLCLGAAIYLALEIGGNKYANFFADRLALFGRTDGDIFAEGAIVGSIRSYGFPTFAIDGLAPLRYHVGALWLAARLNEAGGGDYIAAVLVTKVFVLVPMLIGAALHATILFQAVLWPDRQTSLPALIGSLGMVVFVFPYAGLGFATFASETMSLGAALALLVFPSLYMVGADQETSLGQRSLAWCAAGIAFFALGGAKISMAFVLALVFAWWLLRTEGLLSPRFWISGIVGFVAFLGAYFLFNDTSSMGGAFFGKPYYVEYGFERGEWWIPITYQFETIAALVLLFLLSPRSDVRRITIETLIVASIGGNLPGLLMYIQSGNAVYFIISQAWIAIPILTALLPAGASALATWLARAHRFAPSAFVVLMVLGLGYASYSEARTRASLFVAANALLRSGDLSYYADDKRRIWRADARRAISEFGLPYLLTAPPVEAPGEKLAQALRRMREELGPEVALFIPASNAAYWSLVIDCDGKSLFPVAEAGFALIRGYVPGELNCPMEIALRGFGAPREPSSHDLCTAARTAGFMSVRHLDDLEGGGDLQPCNAN